MRCELRAQIIDELQVTGGRLISSEKPRHYVEGMWSELKQEMYVSMVRRKEIHIENGEYKLRLGGLDLGLDVN